MQTCLGPRLFVADKREQLTIKLDELKQRMDDAGENVRHPFKKKIEQVEAELAELNDLADDHNLGRVGCGHDLSPQFDAIPADGEDYEYLCPKCGNRGSMMKAVME